MADSDVLSVLGVAERQQSEQGSWHAVVKERGRSEVGSAQIT